MPSVVVSDSIVPMLNTALILTLPWCALYIIWTLLRASRLPSTWQRLQQCKTKITADFYHDITPLTDFQWQTIEPLKIRPFKSRYHLTMGLENLPLSDLVAMDKTYLDRNHLRRRLMEQHADATLACNDVGIAAVLELHEWLFGVYLPQRFPTMFQKMSLDAWPDTPDAGKAKNLVTGEVITIKETDAMAALRNIGSHIDTDFLFLLPSSNSKSGEPIYHLEAFATCFPSGFSSRSKLSLPLAEIHKPVPGYASKLERSMDRYFARLNVGKCVKRSNWTITTTDALFVEAGTHLYNEDGADVQTPLEKQRQDIVIDDCRLRTERQTLHRLPKTKALVFAFKTYQYLLKDVKADGDGPALADAIEGLATGSVPEMHYYKRGVIWGEKIARYLREEAS